MHSIRKSVSSAIFACFQPRPWNIPVVVFATLLAACPAAPGHAAPVVKATAGASGTGSTVVLPGFTVGSGNDRVLVVGISARGGAKVQSVTFGAQAFPADNLVGDGACNGDICIDQHGFRAEIWSLGDPPAQTADITVTFTSGTPSAVIGATWYECADAKAPTSVGNTGVVPSGNAVSLTVNMMDDTDQTFSVLSTKKENLNQRPFVQDPAGHMKSYENESADVDLLGAGSNGPGADPLALTWRWNTVNNGIVHPGVAAMVNVRARPNTPPDPPTLSPATVSLGSPSGTVVGTLSAADAEGDAPLTFALVAGSGDADNGSFSISGDKLRTATMFAATGPRSVRVRVRDSKGAENAGALVVTVTENGPPTDLSLSGNAIDENLPAGSTVGTLTTVDPDAGDTHTYVFVSGLGDDDNGDFTIAGNLLKSAVVFNHEARSHYTVRVRSTDSGGLFVSRALGVTINDVNEPPSAAAGPDQEVLLGTVVDFDGSASTDPDDNISGYGWDFGDLATDTGVMVSHLYAAAGVYTATLTVTDAGGLDDDDTAVITIQSPSDAMDDISDDLPILPLNPGQIMGLRAKLNAGIKAWEKGNYTPAINNLNAFINQVEALRGNPLSDAEADGLVAEAEAIIASILFAQGASSPARLIGSADIVVAAPVEPVARLDRSVPNPARTSTRIGWELDRESRVTLSVFDVAGREVARLVDRVQRAGTHSATFERGALPGGVYFYRLTAGQFQAVRRLVLAD